MLDSETPDENPANEGPTEPTDAVGASAPAGDTDAGTGSTKKAAAKKSAAKKTVAKKAVTKKTAAKTAKTATAKKAPAKAAAAKKAATADPPTADAPDTETPDTGAPDADVADQPATKPAKKATAKRAATKKATSKKTAATKTVSAAPDTLPADPGTPPDAGDEPDQSGSATALGAPAVLFKPPEKTAARSRRRRTTTPETADGQLAEASEPDTGKQLPDAAVPDAGSDLVQPDEDTDTDRHDDGSDDESHDEQGGNGRRRRRRGGRRRRKGSGSDEAAGDPGAEHTADDHDDRGGNQDASHGSGQDSGHGEDADEHGEGSSSSRRRRRRRRTGEDGEGGGDDPHNTVTRVRKQRNVEDEITSVTGSTRLEAKKQRRREGREAGRRRAPIVSESEFLARREAVDRVMVIRQREDLTQIAVLEDKVLVEHYVARETQTSLIGNVYLGRVQNVLPSMEAAFVDIGKGRNAVLYAGEVNWGSFGVKNGQRKIEQVLKSGQSILVQVTKDPIGHKGARLTSQVSLPGRFLVYVPDGTTSGISRKLPDTERTRLKTLLKEIVPDTAGVIVRTAAEGASEAELTRDVERLTARWDDIAAKVAKDGDKGGTPQMLYGEPDLTLKVVRDLFTEDFAKLVVSGDDAWDMVDAYVEHVAPDLSERLERYDGGKDVFAAYRVDEQIAKGLDRKVWLPSGGSLVIDRTEAMTVVDVNTGKFTGSGGNLEETVTKNNLEAAEEIVRQLRLRDIGGIIVVDFIDMVLESNRDLVLRRLVECLGRDRTRHQVAEVTSLGLVQMTRKRIGTGLLEAFSETCEHCQGRGVVIHHEPVDPSTKQDDEPRRGRRGRKGDHGDSHGSHEPTPPSPKDIAALARAERKQPEAPAAVPDDAPAPEPAPEPAREPASEHAPEPALEPVPEPVPEPAAEPVPEPAARVETPPPAAGPRVVTTSRRRVSRPAGPPSGTAAAVDGATPHADGAGAEASPADSPPGGEEASDGTGEDSNLVPVHVPVKKKGARKR
jgi:ribonuclease E